MNKRKNNTSPLKIAVLGHKTIPSRQGGIEIVVEELTVRMAKLGHKITVYNRNGHHVSGKEFDEKKLKEYKGIRMKYVPTIDKKGLAAMSASFFAAVAAAFGKYDVVHFHAEGPCAMLWLPKLFGKRCIATVHGLDHQRAKWGKLASTYIMLGEKCAVKFADEIIVLSEGVQNYFKETYGRDTKFIPNGVNRPIIRKAELIDKKFGLKKDDYILFLGRLVPEKGITYLIESFKNVKTDKKLVIAGGSSDTDEFANQLKEMAKDDDRIIFTGFVQGQLLDELYSNGWKKNSFIRNMFGTWWRAFKSSSNFRRTFLLAFYTAMILLRTVLNREIWFDPLGKLLGGWGFYEDGQFTTESIENFMLFVPFSILLLWAFQKELLGESPENIRFGKTVWEATKAVAIFSFLIEFTQLLFHLGTLQISDLTYNTLGGAVGGVIYYLGYSRKTKEIK